MILQMQLVQNTECIIKQQQNTITMDYFSYKYCYICRPLNYGEQWYFDDSNKSM